MFPGTLGGRAGVSTPITPTTRAIPIRKKSICAALVVSDLSSLITAAALFDTSSGFEIVDLALQNDGTLLVLVHDDTLPGQRLLSVAYPAMTGWTLERTIDFGAPDDPIFWLTVVDDQLVYGTGSDPGGNKLARAPLSSLTSETVFYDHTSEPSENSIGYLTRNGAGAVAFIHIDRSAVTVRTVKLQSVDITSGTVTDLYTAPTFDNTDPEWTAGSSDEPRPNAGLGLGDADPPAYGMTSTPDGALWGATTNGRVWRYDGSWAFSDVIGPGTPFFNEIVGKPSNDILVRANLYGTVMLMHPDFSFEDPGCPQVLAGGPIALAPNWSRAVAYRDPFASVGPTDALYAQTF